MRSFILASALLLVALAVVLAISAGHKKETANAAQPAPTPPPQQAQQQPTPTDGVRRVTVEELRTALEKGTAIVVDVRGAEQYKAAHIKGAVWIQESEIAGRVKELPKDKLIVTYCS